jgi:hypothetical protein
MPRYELIFCIIFFNFCFYVKVSYLFHLILSCPPTSHTVKQIFLYSTVSTLNPDNNKIKLLYRPNSGQLTPCLNSSARSSLNQCVDPDPHQGNKTDTDMHKPFRVKKLIFCKIFRNFLKSFKLPLGPDPDQHKKAGSASK